MIITGFVALALLALLSARAFVRSPCRSSGEAERRRGGRLYTFVVDPLTLLIVGLVAGLVFLFKKKGTKLTYDQFQRRRRLLDLFLFLFLAVFWTLEVLTYFNVMGHPFDALKTGNDFMWNGYVEWLIGPIVDTAVPTYRSVPLTILAAALLIFQLPFLLLGRSLGLMTSYFNDLDNWSRPKRP